MALATSPDGPLNSDRISRRIGSCSAPALLRHALAHEITGTLVNPKAHLELPGASMSWAELQTAGLLNLEMRAVERRQVNSITCCFIDAFLCLKL